MIRTACIRGMSPESIKAAGITYIGRPCPRRGLRGHKLANPYKVGRDGTREEVLAKYRAYLLASPDLIAFAVGMAREAEAAGKPLVLGCWCSRDEGCHRDVVKEVMEGR